MQKGVNLTPKGELEKGVWRLYNKSMTSIKLSENGGKAPEAVPYMPAGLNEICCTVNGRAGKRTVMVDAAACERLEADLQEQIKAHQAGGRARPVILFDHKAGAAAAVPTGFEWDEKRGILLHVEWTQAGRAAVEGGNYAYISPAFKLAPQSESITGLQDGVEVGSLVNDPAFTRNECIAAAREVVEDVQVYAANPYGCNQYGEVWKAPHNGKQSAPGKAVKKGDEEQENSEIKKITEDYENAEKAYREADNKVWKNEDEIEEAYNKGDYEKADKLERKQSRLIAEANKLKVKAKEAKEKWRKATNSDYDVQDLVDLEKEEREKNAEAVENNVKIKRLKKERSEAEKAAAWSRSSRDKNKVKKIEEKLRKAEEKQKELYDRISEIHKIFNPDLELKASFADIEEELEAENPYGCNQYGHEWRAKHGDGFAEKKGGKDENAEVTERYNKVKPRAERVLKEYEEANSLWTGAELGSRARKVNRLRLIREIWGHMDSAKNRVKRMMDGKEGLSEKEETDLNEELDILEKEAKSAKKWANIINRQYEEEELKAAFAELEKELEDEFILAADLTPFCNVEKNTKEGDNIRAANNGSERTTEENSDMETVKKQLGLGADATPADVAAAIAALKKKSEAGQKRIEEVEAECNEHKKALQEHKEKAADGFIERLRKGGKVAHKDEETLKAAREMYMENPERTERIYAAMQPICPPEEGEGDKVQANRVPSGDATKMSVADFYAGMDF